MEIRHWEIPNQVSPSERIETPKQVVCHNCNEKGHFSSQCPANALMCTTRRVHSHGSTVVTCGSGSVRPGVHQSGRIEDAKVEDILLDTGCSRTIVHESYVPKSKYVAGEAVAICCAHGDTVMYPITIIDVVSSIPLQVEAVVSTSLPVSMLSELMFPS